MPTIDEARIAVLKEWNVWAANHSEDAQSKLGGLMFYNYLQKECPYLLEFKFKGTDKWQRVHAWLLSAGLVKD
jgi:hypothetical protein